MSHAIWLADAFTVGLSGEYLASCVLEPAFRADDIEVLVALTEHPNLADAEFDRLAHHRDDAVRSAALKTGRCSATDVTAAVTDPSETIRTTVAGLPGVDEAQRRLLADDVEAVQLALLDADDLSIELVRHLCEHGSLPVQMKARELAEDRGVRFARSPELVDALASVYEEMNVTIVNPHQVPSGRGGPVDPNAIVDIDAIIDGGAAEIDELLNGSDADRRSVAKLPRIPEHARVLAHDPSPSVRTMFQQRGDLRRDEAELGVCDPDDHVRTATVSNASCPDDVRDRAANDPCDTVRAGVARHTKDPLLWARYARDVDVVRQQLSLQVEYLDVDTVLVLAGDSDTKIQRQVALNRTEPERLDFMRIEDLRRWKVNGWQERLEAVCPDHVANARSLLDDWSGSLDELATVAKVIG